MDKENGYSLSSIFLTFFNSLKKLFIKKKHTFKF